MKTKILSFSIILLSFAIGFYFYPQMPLRMASHWNFAGQVDGYISKFWGLFLMPVLSLGLYLLFILIPKVDPLKANIDKFRKYFDRFILLLIVFLFYLYLLTILWNIGKRFSMNQFLTPAFTVLFYYCGVLVENAKMNWFIGIRTPWTLSSEVVWQKTHELGGKLFKAVGLVAFLGIFFPTYALFLILLPVLVSTIYLIIYSYWEYKHLAPPKQG